MQHIPKPNKGQRRQIKRHVSVVRTNYLLMLYVLIIGLSVALGLSSCADTTPVSKPILTILFSGISLFFVALVFVTIRDRQIDVIEDDVTEREENF